MYDDHEPIETQRLKLLIGLGALFGVIGALLLLPSFAATNNLVIEAENSTRAAFTKESSGDGSSNSFITLNSGATGGMVTLPASIPTGTTSAIATGMLYGTIGCHTSEPICIFGWQTDDLYDANGANAYCACMQIRNVQTGAVIKEFSANSAPESPINGNRPLAIHNPDDNEWLIAYHATPRNGGNDSQLYAVRIDATGNFLGSTISLSDTPMEGWVPKGVYDTVHHKYFIQWHQRMGDYNASKDMFATVIDRTGAVTDKNYNINKSDGRLDEYGSVAFNATSGEIMSIMSDKQPDDCDDCTRNLYAYRLQLSDQGKVSQLGMTEIDTDNDVEWGLSMAYNKTANSYVVTYREGTTARRAGGLTKVYTMVLGANGNVQATPVKLGDTIDDYWVTGTACSTQTNVCAATFIANGVYIDAASTGVTTISAVGPHGAGNFTWNGSKVAYIAALDKFGILGNGQYLLAPGR